MIDKADHATCRRAVLDGSGEVRCCDCGEELGTWAARPAGAIITNMRGDLARRPVEHDGLRTYGLPDRVRLRKNPRRSYFPPFRLGPGRSILGSGFPPPGLVSKSLSAVSGTGVTEVYVYCPNPACGRGQHAGRLPSP